MDIEKLAYDHGANIYENDEVRFYTLNAFNKFAEAYHQANCTAEVFNLEQILHDPENQPSQYGTVPLEWYENLENEINRIRFNVQQVIDSITGGYDMHAIRKQLQTAVDNKSLASYDQQEAVTNLWEALGKWSAYLASNGEQANLAPPSWLIDAVSSATSPNKQIPDGWISTKDRLPDQLELKIKLIDGSEIYAWYQSDGDYYWNCGGREIFIDELKVTHWMPLPAQTTSLTSETNTEVGNE